LLNDPNNKAFDQVDDVGIAIRTIGPDRQVHIGVLYRTDQANVFNLNLRTHLDLRNEAPTEAYCWMQIQLDEINRRLLASLCALIASRSSAIPYGFTYNGLYFSESGEFKPRELGHGLTCATFVMALFETYSIPALITTEWGQAGFDDQIWQSQMTGRIGRERGEWIAGAIGKHIGQPRYRPEEAAAGAVDKGRPLGFAKASKMGKQILQDLAKLRP
jgi:hypothetical protein